MRTADSLVADVANLKFCVFGGCVVRIRMRRGNTVLMSTFRYLVLLLLGSAVAMLPAFWAGAQSIDSVDHRRINALIEILERNEQVPGQPRQINPAPEGMEAVPDEPPGPAPLPPLVVGMTPQPGSVPGETLFGDHVPNGKGCPSKVKDFSRAVDDAEATAQYYEKQLASLKKRYDSADEAMVENRVSGEITCAEYLISGISNLLESLGGLDVAEHLQPIENLGFCAQRTAESLNRDMEAIKDDAPVGEQRRREQLGRQLDVASKMDIRLYGSLTRLATVRQKKIRLVKAAESFREECEADENLNFGVYE